MIKSKKGKVLIKGNTADVLAEFGCIYMTLVEKLGKHIINEVITQADTFEMTKGDNEHESN